MKKWIRIICVIMLTMLCSINVWASIEDLDIIEIPQEKKEKVWN